MTARMPERSAKCLSTSLTSVARPDDDARAQLETSDGADQSVRGVDERDPPFGMLLRDERLAVRSDETRGHRRARQREALGHERGHARQIDAEDPLLIVSYRD